MVARSQNCDNCEIEFHNYSLSLSTNNLLRLFVTRSNFSEIYSHREKLNENLFDENSILIRARCLWKESDCNIEVHEEHICHA